MLFCFRELPYGGLSLCALKEDSFVIGTTALQFIKYHPDKSENFTIPAHKMPIDILVPLFLNKKKHANYVLSASNGDRFVYAW